MIPTDAQERKNAPLVTGCLDYFPLALLDVARCSKAGNDQHNPGTELHWDRSKSKDEADSCGRHLLQRGTIDTDGIRHSTKAAWRALANLEKELEAADKVDKPRDWKAMETSALKRAVELREPKPIAYSGPPVIPSTIPTAKDIRANQDLADRWG